MRRLFVIALTMFMVAIGAVTLAQLNTPRDAVQAASADPAPEILAPAITAPPVPTWSTTTSTTVEPVTTTTSRPVVKSTPKPKPKASVPAKAAASVPASAAGGDVWDLVYKCEGVRGGWANMGPSFQGGLGFAASTWAAMGRQFASNAGLASPAQQKIVAERIMPGGPRWPGRYLSGPHVCDGYRGW